MLVLPTNHRVCSVNCWACDARTNNNPPCMWRKLSGIHVTLVPPTNHRVCSVNCRACDARTTNNHRVCSVNCRICDALPPTSTTDLCGARSGSPQLMPTITSLLYTYKTGAYRGGVSEASGNPL